MSESPVIDVHDNLRLLGTAHVATASVEAVRHQIATYQPDLSCGLSWRAKDFDALLPGERAALVQDRLLLEAGSMVPLAPRLRLLRAQTIEHGI